MVKQSEKAAKGKISARCDHIAIFTNNAQRVLVFYVKIMGFRKEREEALPESIMKSIFGIASECRFITLAAGGARIELFQPLKVRLKKETECPYRV
jgi:catechol 2,3-dioxygenase-like lactoylglutathione lyase family enzyme